MSPRTLHHEIDGELHAADSSGVPLLLGSSIGTSRALWAETVAALIRNGGPVIRWDLPGHGVSPADLLPAGPATVADFAALVLELADSLGIARFNYAGDSFGGAIGAWLAVHRPDRINALAIICSSAHFGDSASWRARAQLVRAEGATAIAQQYVSAG